MEVSEEKPLLEKFLVPLVSCSSILGNWRLFMGVFEQAYDNQLQYKNEIYFLNIQFCFFSNVSYKCVVQNKRNDTAADQMAASCLSQGEKHVFIPLEC